MQTALEMLKIRLNRSASALDEYFTNLLHAEAGDMTRRIRIQDTDIRD